MSENLSKALSAESLETREELVDGGAALLEVRDLTIWRGENLLVDGISFAVERAGVVQIQGMNGSGKTTLLRALIGLAEYDEGEIFYRGVSLSNASDRLYRDELYAQLLYLGHKSGISPGLTPLENLQSLCPELKVGTREKVTDVLQELAIADRIDLPSTALSAGQKRRISLARLRLQKARLWVLDEPLTSLDADGLAWVKHEIQRHVAEGGSVVLTTHQSMSFDNISPATVVLDHVA